MIELMTAGPDVREAVVPLGPSSTAQTVTPPRGEGTALDEEL